MPRFPDAKVVACAFFDVDGTLIRIKSMFSFMAYMFDELQIGNTPAVLAYSAKMREMMDAGIAREELNRFYYSIYAGMPVTQIDALARQWYALYCRSEVFYAEMVQEIRQHQARGTRIVIVSGSFDAVLRPLMEELGIDGVIAAPLEIDENGCYTGQLTGLSTIGEGKAQGMRAYAQQHGLILQDCAAYGDDISDFPMLASVGSAVVINPDAALLSKVQALGWQSMQVA
jgi:HAD superfamily hydrolase (TIGR01490 family)